jgi:hypothetical protein
MAIAIIVRDAFLCVLEQLRRLPERVCSATAVMQGFNLEILVLNLLTDRRQLVTEKLDLV